MLTRKVLLCCVAALALLAVAVTAGKPQPPQPPADPAILYGMSVPYKGNDYNIATDYSICVMNEDGSNQTTLVSVSTHGIAAMAAGWAPDNRRFAFCGPEPDNHWRIYVAEIDTTNGVRAVNIRTLYRNPTTYYRAQAGNPSWSTDGQWVFFHNYTVELGNTELFAIRADGTSAGEPVRLTFTTDRDESTPRADRYGRFIAYKADGDGLYMATLQWDGGLPSIGEPTSLTDGGPLEGLDCHPPTISPDGTRFLTFADGRRWTIPVDYPGTAVEHVAPAGLAGTGCWLDDDTLLYRVNIAKPSQVFLAKGGVDYTGDQTILVTAPRGGTVGGPNPRWRAP